MTTTAVYETVKDEIFRKFQGLELITKSRNTKLHAIADTNGVVSGIGMLGTLQLLASPRAKLTDIQHMSLRISHSVS